MEKLICEMYEDFIMSEAYSKWYAEDQDSEAQDVIRYLLYHDHATLCKRGAEVCHSYLRTKNIYLLIYRFRKLELYDNIAIINNVLGNL